ncbi:MAG: PCP reductase family protein [Chloroflexi bacterium]|nr:PCP reductase family protein [Chloroflexota bacterium]
MKFLCANCDEPMKLEEATGPEEGSMSITFGCAKCGNRTSLLTNPGETQLVRALNVHVGGRAVPAEPMELVRGTLARQRNQALAPQTGTPRPAEGLVWTEEAEKRLENVPAFARGMARKAIERYALEEGYDRITPEVMDGAREKR